MALLEFLLDENGNIKSNVIDNIIFDNNLLIKFEVTK